MRLFVLVWAIFLLSMPTIVLAEDAIEWPQKQAVAVSLSYDDALASQLDYAIPELDKHNFKGSFYLTLSSIVIKERLEEWRQAAKRGHELGNHTILHSCRASLENREWVTVDHNLDNYTVTRVVEEVAIANSFLHAIDGQNERTFTPPCNDFMVENKNYLNAIKSMFLGFKLWPEVTKPNYDKLLIADNIDAKQMIAFLEQAKHKEKLVHILFHGIGGDHMSVSAAEHKKLLQYLDNNRDVYWVDSYINIIRYANSKGSYFQDLSTNIVID